MDDNIKDSKIKILMEEYNKYSSYFISFQNHIEKCYNDFIINIKERNNYLKIVNDSLRILNSKYNESIVEIYEEDTDTINKETLVEHKNLLHVHKMIGINTKDNNAVGENRKLSCDNFKDVTASLLKLGTKIGFSCINDALSIIIDEQYKYILTEEVDELIKFYNDIFIPLSYQTTKMEDTRSIFVKDKEPNNNIILQNYADIYIRYNESYVIITGYFINDSLNIILRTSQLNNNMIYKRKKELEIFALKSKTIDEQFIRMYMRNISLHDIIILNDNEFLAKLEKEYASYNNIVKMSFINLRKEFFKEGLDTIETIKNMFNMIKLLLMGTDESINVAGLLFNIIKKEKQDTELNISDIIYKNLSYISQIKLRKSNVNIKLAVDKLKSYSTDEVDLKKQIVVCKNMPEVVKKAAFEKVEEMKSANNEYYKQLLYVKTLLNFPWPSKEEDNFFLDISKNKKKSKEFLDGVIDKLNSKVYGHNECKDSIKELLGKWICNPSSSGSAIGLLGPPGVGKTLIAKAIGESLDIPFVQITLGGQNDGELLHGHGYTYSGSQPGMIIKKMVEAGNARCIIYFDELDKACKKYDTNEIYNILIHITDPNTNTEFQDRFFQEIKFPLNKVLFIFSYNDSGIIDPILMDRIKEIEVKPFKLLDKKTIVDKFILKDMCKLVNFNDNSVLIDDDAVEFIINRYTHEPGVRELKRKFEKIFLKLNLARIYNKRPIFTKNRPFKLTKKIIEDYLGKNNIHIQFIHDEDLVGVINGLYATDSGQGGILPIEIFENYTNNDNKFILKMTGSQRRVMKESVVSAFTAALHCIDKKIRDQYLKKNIHGFHINCPSSSVPKDGPSAGCAFAVAFISRILNKKIKRDVSVTGEIELTGKVTKIGGLHYKLPGAKRAGVKLVLISNENTEDIETMKNEYPDLFDEDFNVHLVSNLKEVLELILIDYDTQY
jgi:ATP-dependent Lon protease